MKTILQYTIHYLSRLEISYAIIGSKQFKKAIENEQFPYGWTLAYLKNLENLKFSIPQI